MDDEVRRSWLTRWRLMAGAAVIVVVAFLALFPGWAIRRAHDRWIDCTNEVYETAQGTPGGCTHDALLWLPKHLPWTSKEARALSAKIAYDDAENTLKLAALRDLDAKARDRAAGALVDALRANPERTFTASSRLRDAAADATLIARAADLQGQDRAEALQVAIRHGDREAVARITALPAPADASDWDRVAGEVRCANGDAAGGLAALDRFDAMFFKQTNAHSVDTQFAMLACDVTRHVEIDPAWHDRESFLRAFGGGEREPLQEAFDPQPRLAGVELATRTIESDVDDVLALMSPRNVGTVLTPRVAFFSPWSVFEYGDDWPFAPQWADDAARSLATLATTAKPRKRDEDYIPKASEAARTHPAAFLEWGAMVMDVEAAQGWLRLGNLPRALASARAGLELAHSPHVAEIDPDASLLVLGTLELAGDWTAARAEVDTLATRPAAPEVAAMIALHRALVLAHAHDLAGAATAAAAIPPDSQLADAGAWLSAALATAQGHPPAPASTPPAKLGIDVKPRDALAYWLSAAAALPTNQILIRWRAGDEALSSFGVDPVMPAVYVVVGAAAGKGDVEMWLDIAMSSQVVDVQAALAARAEAARWRGDTASAERWDARLAAVRALARDDRAAYLLRAALRH